MNALDHVGKAAQEGVNTVGGAARVVTSPFASNRNTPDEIDRFVRERVGTLLDGFLIIPSVGVLYALLADNEGQSRAWRYGKGIGMGLAVYAVSTILRRVIL